MPDTRLTLAGLKEHLRRHIIVYIVGIILTVVLTDLLWTATTPVIPDEQVVLIYMADRYSNAEPLSDIAADMLARTQAADPNVRRVEFESLFFTTPDENYAGVMLLLTRLATGEGDAFLAGADAMDQLVSSGALLALDDYAGAGWLAGSGLEPYTVTTTDDETGEEVTMLAGYRLDALDALFDMQAFNNEGAFLAVAAGCRNVDSTLKAIEIMVEDLKDWSDAA